MNPIADDFAVRLLVGALFGSAIGFERQWRQRSAGLQTSALVTTGATLFAFLDTAYAGANSTRILANIVSGVGFLRRRRHSQGRHECQRAEHGRDDMGVRRRGSARRGRALCRCRHGRTGHDTRSTF